MTIKSAIAYIRRSTNKGQKYSEDAQLLEIQEFAEKYNIKIIKVYKETASGKDTNRPEFEKALRLAKQKKLPIIVDSISRIGRDAGQVISLLNELVFISVEDGLKADEFELQKRAIEAQREGNQISRRTRNSLKAAKNKGVSLGNPNMQETQKLGVAKVKQNADEFALSLEGILSGLKNRSFKKQAEFLAQANVPTRQGGQWTAQSVKNVHNRLKAIKESKHKTHKTEVSK